MLNSHSSGRYSSETRGSQSLSRPGRTPSRLRFFHGSVGRRWMLLVLQVTVSRRRTLRLLKIPTASGFNYEFGAIAGKVTELNSTFKFMFESTMKPGYLDIAQSIFKVLKVFVSGCKVSEEEGNLTRMSSPAGIEASQAREHGASDHASYRSPNDCGEEGLNPGYPREVHRLEARRPFP